MYFTLFLSFVVLYCQPQAQSRSLVALLEGGMRGEAICWFQVPCMTLVGPCHARRQCSSRCIWSS